MSTRFVKSLLSFVMILLTVITFSIPNSVRADVTHCGTLSTDETWLANDNVHIVTCDVTVPASITLTIEVGAIVKFQDDAQINVNGKLNAQGTVGVPIYFTSYYDDAIGGDSDGTPTSGTVGDWGNIEFYDSSDDTSTIEYAVIRFSGSDSGSTIDDGAIRLKNGSPNLSHITFSDNFINAVQIQGNRNWEADTWNNTTVIYVVHGGEVTIPVGNTLTISPGMKIKFSTYAGFQTYGRLNASGTAVNPIYFSSHKDDTLCGIGAFNEEICDSNNDGTSTGAVGDWSNIEFYNSSDDTSVITYAVIRYSGRDNWGSSPINDGAIRLKNGSPNLSYITFSDNFINAVQIQGNRNWETDT